MEHHPYGFSKWPALAVCPHYESDDKERKSAKDGTDNHECLSDYINEINTGVPALHDNDNARWAAQFISEMARGSEIHSETPVKVPDIAPAGGIYGTCDAWTVVDNQLHVFDYKSGAKSNIDHMPQVMGYAYALAMTDAKECSADDIFCHVLYGASHEVISTKVTLLEARDLAIKIAFDKDNKDNMEPCANGYCQYCKHNKECKAMAGNIIEFKNNALSSMSDAALYDWLLSAKQAIDRWLDDLKDIAKNNGGALDDGKIRYELRTDKRGRMQTVDVAQLWYDMSDKGCSITQDQLMKACTISKKAFADLYKADAKAHGLLVKDVEAQYAERCTFGEPATKLVKVEAK